MGSAKPDTRIVDKSRRDGCACSSIMPTRVKVRMSVPDTYRTLCGYPPVNWRAIFGCPSGTIVCPPCATTTWWQCNRRSRKLPLPPHPMGLLQHSLARFGLASESEAGLRTCIGCANSKSPARWNGALMVGNSRSNAAAVF